MKPIRRRRRVDAQAHWGQRANPRTRPYEPNVRLTSVERPAKPKHLPPGPERAALTCQAKEPYLSELLARNAAQLIAFATGGPVQDAYRCGFCPDWHLTSSVR